jgi:hypothetical protein
VPAQDLAADGNPSLPGDRSDMSLARLIAYAVRSSMTPRELERHGQWPSANRSVGVAIFLPELRAGLGYPG